MSRRRSIVGTWIRYLARNEIAWQEGRYHDVLTDTELIDRFLDLYPDRLYLRSTYDVPRHRTSYNTGNYTGGRTPADPSYKYDKQKAGRWIVFQRMTPRGKVIEELKMPKKKTSKRGSKKVSKKTVTKKRSGVSLETFIIGLFKSNSRDKLTDQQILARIRKAYPDRDNWQREDALAYVQSYRASYNRGKWNDGTPPATQSFAYGPGGEKLDPRRGPDGAKPRSKKKVSKKKTSKKRRSKAA